MINQITKLLVTQLAEQTTSNNHFESWQFVLLTAIVLPIFMWIISPKDIKEKIKNFLNKRQIDSKNLNSDIKKLNLGISNENQLLVDEFVNNFKYVFFPVVPNKSPNIIHVTFINAIKGLEKLGLHVYVFIFDDYFCKVKDYDTKERETYINNFSKSLQSMGIKKKQIIFESDYLKKKRKTKKIISTIYNITSKINIEEANGLSVVNEHYLNGKSKYIRNLKSILNMTYSQCISKKIGFVLSGKDEQKLWEIYVDKVDKNIVHLYIEALYTTPQNLTNILALDILSCEDSSEQIRQKVYGFLNDINVYNENCGIFYLLKNNYFIYGKEISFVKANGLSYSVSNIEALMKYCKEQMGNQGGIADDTVEAISEIVYNIFHLKKGEK